jgi:hypothetical protein
MRRFLALGAAALLPLVVAGGAGGSGTQFAVGSAKTEIEATAGVEHLSFSAQSRPTEDFACAAKGSAVYRNAMQIKVDLDTLVIDGPLAEFSGVITSAQPALSGPARAQFTVFDREAFVDDPSVPEEFPPADAFRLDAIVPAPVERECIPPTIVSQPITKGNIVIKATGPMLLP